MTRVIRTMSPEEEAAFVANPASFAARGGRVETMHYGICGHRVANAFTTLCRTCYDAGRRQGLLADARACVIPTCNEPKTTTGRCAKHEAIWQRLHGVVS